MTMREKAIEAMAKALAGWKPHEKWNPDRSPHQKGCLCNAKIAYDAALDALAEPTEEMVEAGAKAVRYEQGTTDGEYARRAYTAMIHAAQEGK